MQSYAKSVFDVGRMQYISYARVCNLHDPSNSKS